MQLTEETAARLAKALEDNTRAIESKNQIEEEFANKIDKVIFQITGSREAKEIKRQKEKLKELGRSQAADLLSQGLTFQFNKSK